MKPIKPYIILQKTEAGAPCLWEKGGFQNHTVMIADKDGKPKTPIHVIQPGHVKPSKRHALFLVGIGDIIAIGQETGDRVTSFKNFYEVVGRNYEVHPSKEVVHKAILKPISWLRAKIVFGAFYRAFNAKLKTFDCMESLYNAKTQHSPTEYYHMCRTRRIEC